MPDRSLRVRLGAFVALSVLALGGLIVVFGGAPTLFSNRAKYTVTFSEAPGLTTGTPVRKSGVRVGEVTGIELDDTTGLVNVSVQVDPKYLPRPSEEPTITRGILSGDTALDIVPKLGPNGTRLPPAEPYPPGTVIPGVTPFNARALLNQASGVIPSAQESVIRIMQSFQRFEAATPKVEKALDEIAGLARAGREVVPELRQTNTRVQELLGAADPADPGKPSPTLRAALQEIIDLLRAVRPVADDLRVLMKDNGPEIARTLRSIKTTSDSVNDLLNPDNRKAVSATLKNFSAASDDLVKTIRLAAILLDQAERTVRELNARLGQSEKIFANLEKITKPAAASSEQIVKDTADTVKSVNAAAATLNAILADLRDISKAATRADGTLQKVLGDPALYNNLNDAAASLNRLIVRAEKITRDLEVFADKIARKPETLGVGGALRPSTGLKESPFAPAPVNPLLPVPPSNVPVPRQPIDPEPAPPLTPFPPVGVEPRVGPVVPTGYRVPRPRAADLPN